MNSDDVVKQFKRWFLPSLCVVLPLFFYFVVFHILVDSVQKAAPKLDAEHYVFLSEIECIAGKSTLPAATAKNQIDTKLASPEPSAPDPGLAMKAQDISGRYAFAIASAFGRMIAMLGFAAATFAVWRCSNGKPGSTAGMAALIVALGTFVGLLLDLQPGTRASVLKSILPLGASVLQLGGQVAGWPGTGYAIITSAISWNLTLGAIGLIATFFGFAAVAYVRSVKIADAVNLRERLMFLRIMLAAQMGILILTIITTKASVDWATSLLCAPQRLALQPVGVALGNFWGAAAISVILTSFLPAYVAWQREVSACARAARPGSYAEQQKLVVEEGLDFAAASSILFISSLALPALTGPFIEVLKATVSAK